MNSYLDFEKPIAEIEGNSRFHITNTQKVINSLQSRMTIIKIKVFFYLMNF